MIQLGQKVRSVVNGFEGIVIARTEWLNRCVRISVKPAVVREANGKQVVDDYQTFDEEELEVIVAEPIKLPVDKPKQTGGDRSDVVRVRDPR